jgi:hypothetical protein
MQGVIYEERSVLVFLLVTIFLGGGAAWISGRSTAQMWRPWIILFFSTLGLGVGVRFIHFALFGGTFFTPHYYIVDTIILMAIGSTAYRFTLARQMVAQYGWLYEKTGPFSWRTRTAPEAASNETG